MVESNLQKQIFVFGNQKSGTTAIAALFAKILGCSCTLDIPPVWHNELALHDGTISMESLVANHPDYFSKRLIKEPCLTFLYDRLMPLFPNVAQVFIVRHPAENVRSILDRLETPGSLSRDINIEDYARFGSWKEVMDGKLFGICSDHYIDRLATRWALAAKLYLAHRDEMELVRYETFLQDKVGLLSALAEALELTAVGNVSGLQDVQYQPIGANRGMHWKEFFGARNLARIQDITSPYLDAFGYSFEA